MPAIAYVPKEAVDQYGSRSVVNRDSVAIPGRRIVALTNTTVDAVVLATGPSVPIYGVVGAHFAILPGEYGDVALRGKKIVEAGGAFSRGDALTSDGSGRAVKTTTAGDRLVGWALSDASGAGAFVEVELAHGAVR